MNLYQVSNESHRVVINYTQDIDEKEQVNHMIWFRERIDRETGEVTKQDRSIDFQFLTHEGVLNLIRGTGFEVVDDYSDFDRSNYTESANRMIIECIKSD
jgi:hypothetical protein